MDEDGKEDIKGRDPVVDNSYLELLRSRFH